MTVSELQALIQYVEDAIDSCPVSQQRVPSPLLQYRLQLLGLRLIALRQELRELK